MAESGKITREDIIAKDAFTEPVAEAKELLKVVTEIQNALKVKAKQSTDGFAIASPQTLDDVAKLTKQIEELKKQILLLEEANKKQKKATEALTQAQAEEILARQKQRQEITQQAKLNSDLTSTYEKQVVRLAQIKKELKNISAEGGKAPKALTDEFKKLDASVRKAEEAVGEHQRSVGNYKQALQGLSGPLGNAANGISTMGDSLKALLLNPVALAIAAVSAAVYGLFKAFTSTDDGSVAWAVKMEQASAVLDVFRKKALNVITVLYDIFKGDYIDAAIEMNEAIGGTADQLGRATKGAEEYVIALDKLEDSQSNFLVQSAKTNLAIAQLEFNAADKTFSIKQRRDFLVEAIRLSEEEAFQQKKYAEDKYNIEVAYLSKKTGLTELEISQYVDMTDAQKESAAEAIKTARNQYEEEFKALNEFRANVFGEEQKFYEENKRNKSKITGFDETIEKEKEERLKKISEENAKRIKKEEEEIKTSVQLQLEELEIEAKAQKSRDEQSELELEMQEKEMQGKIDAVNKQIEIDDEQLEKDKKRLEERLELERKVQQQVLEGIEQGTKRRSEIVQNGLEQEIQKQNEAIAKQQELAAKGLDNTLAYQEKKREELQAKLEREKEAERRREEALQLAGAFLGSYQSRLDAKQNTTQALAGALADTLIAKAISSTIAGAFAGGVEDFQGKGTGTSDSNLIAFSHGESVVTAKATQKYSGLVTAMNKGLVDDYVKQMILPNMDEAPKANGSSFQSAAIIYTLNTKLESLEKAIKNKQEIKVNWNAQGERVEEIVKDGMKTVIKHVTTGKRRL